MKKHCPSYHNRFIAVIFPLVVAMIIFLFFAGNVYAQECSELQLTEALKEYQTGNFEMVIQLLEPCVETGFQDKQREQGYRLLILTYQALDSVVTAQQYAVRLLLLNPNYEPNVFDPPRYIQLIDKLKQSGSATMITSVSKKAENIYEAPATVTIINEEDIKARGYIDLEALFSDLPGFDVSRTYGVTYSNIYQRGYRSNNTERTLFLMDGVEENDFWSNGIFWSPQFPISNVKRVEVVYGPASTMYGPNALVGVVNVITKEPEEIARNHSVGVNANFGYGSYDTRYSDITIAAKYKSLAFTGTVRKFYSDLMDLSKYEEFNYDPDDYNSIDYAALLNVTSQANTYARTHHLVDNHPYYTIERNTQGDTVGISLTQTGVEIARTYDKQAFEGELNGAPIRYSNRLDALYYYGKLRLSDLVIGYESWWEQNGSTNYFPDNRRAAADNAALWIPIQDFFYAKYDKVISENLSVNNFAQYRVIQLGEKTGSVVLKNYSNKGLNLDSLIKDIPGSWDTYYSYQISRQFRNEFKITFNPIPKLDVIAGLEVRNSSIQGDYRKIYSDTLSVIEQGSSSGDTIPGANDFTIYDIGGYGQGTYRLFPWWKITLGARYDYNRIRVSGGYGTQLNPRFAMVFTPNRFIIKMIYARAFQNASNWTKYAITPQRRLSNPTLPPEKVNNYEASIAYQISNRLIWSIGYYYANYEGVVGTAIVSYQGGTTGQNRAIGALKISGLESAMTLKFDKLQFYANYNYSNPQNNILDKNGNLTGEYQRIGDISSHRINCGVQYTFWEHLLTHLRMNYYSDRPVGPETSVSANPGNFPGVFLLNGTIAYDNIFPGFTLQFIGNNLTNKEYSDPGIRSADGNSYAYRTPQKDRNFIIRLMYQFN